MIIKKQQYGKKPLITAGAVIDFRDSWRIFRIMAEFVEGYEFLGKLSNEITILGSARLPSNNKYYKIAVELGKMLGRAKFSVLTGGGPGIMEAANKGAYEGGGESAGLNIQLPFEQRTNPYVKKSIGFYYFFSRKVMLTSPANAFVFFPGGFGTLDEFFEVVDYIELEYMEKTPIIMVGKEYWQPIVDFLRKKSCNEIGSIPDQIIDGWHIVETAQEAFDHLADVKDRPHLCQPGSKQLYCQGGIDWRIFRIMAELVEGFEFIANNKMDVTVFGTKSIDKSSEYYKAAHKLGQVLAENNLNVVTGGGPGAMEAANKGAFERGGNSFGINMKFEHEERVNAYLNKSAGFYFPFVRKLIITSPAKMFVFFPGGLGTLHQLFEILTLLETKKIQPIPIILYGSKFWEPLLGVINDLYLNFKTIGASDKELITVVDSPEVVIEILNSKESKR
ncbi:MAG: TIGR00730 family Rossman fold protein, partial [bacterium]